MMFHERYLLTPMCQGEAVGLKQHVVEVVEDRLLLLQTPYELA